MRRNKMTLSKSQLLELDSRPEIGEYVFSGEEEVAPSEGERIIYMYVDYGLLRREGTHRFWGNWTRLTSEACDDRQVDSYIDRRNMRNYEFIRRCAHHSEHDDGIYKFSIAVGGA